MKAEDSMRAWLQGYLAGQVPPAELTILYHIGDEFSGETDFRLRGDGAYTLWSTATSGRARRDFAGQVERGAVQEVARALIDARIWDVHHVRSLPGDDDPESRIAVRKGDTQQTVALWVSEIGERPAFAEAQEAILNLIRAVSRGEVLEVGH